MSKDVYSSISTTFLARLKGLRKKHKIIQADIAVAIKVSRQAYNNYESGKRQPDISTLALIADFFGVSTDYLLGRTQSGVLKENYVSLESEREHLSDEEYLLALNYRKLDIEDRADIRGYLNGKLSAEKYRKVVR